jgi:hypothetical protein
MAAPVPVHPVEFAVDSKLGLGHKLTLLASTSYLVFLASSNWVRRNVTLYAPNGLGIVISLIGTLDAYQVTPAAGVKVEILDAVLA